MSPAQKITRKEVALAAKVSTFTVSQVVAGRSGPSEKTRRHVLSVAKRLGYKPNIAASVLSSQRHSAAKKRFKIGYLQRTFHAYRQELLLRAAEEMDIDVELVDLTAFSSPSATGKALYNLGFEGLLFTSNSIPWTPEERRHFPWDQFSLIKLDRACPDIRCNIIRHSAFDYANRSLENICALGYKNLAVVLIETPSSLDDDARFGAVYNFRERKLPPGARLSIHISTAPPAAPLKPETLLWLRKLQPDVAVFLHRGMAEAYLNQTTPEQRCPSVAAFHVEPDRFSNPHQIAGCLVRVLDHHKIALHQLIELIRNNRKGFGKYPSETVIETEWFQGKSLFLPKDKSRRKIREADLRH